MNGDGTGGAGGGGGGGIAAQCLDLIVVGGAGCGGSVGEAGGGDVLDTDHRSKTGVAYNVSHMGSCVAKHSKISPCVPRFIPTYVG